MADNIRFEIRNHVGVLSENPNTGWTTEVNVVSWNGKPDKYDIRPWSPDHERMAKGITLTETEARALARALGDHFGRQQA